MNRAKQVAALRGAHQKIAEKLSPMADDAGFSLTIGLSSAADKEQDLGVIRKTLSALADQELATLQAVLELRAEANLLLGILVEASDLPSLDLLPPVRDRFMATAGRIDKAVKVLKDPDIAKLFEAFVAFGKSDGNVFDLRKKELETASAAAKVVAENGALAKDFDAQLADLERRSEAAARHGREQFRSGDLAGQGGAHIDRAAQSRRRLPDRLALCRARGGPAPDRLAGRNEVDRRRQHRHGRRNQRLG